MAREEEVEAGLASEVGVGRSAAREVRVVVGMVVKGVVG